MGGSSYAICGRNGTGKSGVVDAIEFGLTGNISRLSGSGTGDVSVKEHAPHVDSRNNPDKSLVKIEIFIPSLNKKATIERTVGNSSRPKITPNDPDVIEIFELTSSHPEFVLSRRELIRYVLSTPGERSKQVQALLRLDLVEEVRSIFKKIANAEKKQILPLEKEREYAKNQLLAVLGITDLGSKNLIDAVNKKREIISLPPIIELKANTSIKDGISSIVPSQPINQIPKKQSLETIVEIRAVESSIKQKEIQDKIKLSIEELRILETNTLLKAGMDREKILTLSLGFANEEACPVCDIEWEEEKLKSVIVKKLKIFEAATKKRHEVETMLAPLREKLTIYRNLLEQLSILGTKVKKEAEVKDINAIKDLVSESILRLNDFIPFDKTVESLLRFSDFQSSIEKSISEIEAEINKIPEPTEQNSAIEYLTVAQERLENYRGISLRLLQANNKSDLSNKIYEEFGNTSDTVLGEIYNRVQDKFKTFYRDVNSSDEADFEAKLIPSFGKLAFDVDFYGKGYFPPGAYHSEGHQDGMGLCLYLALMDHILGNGFTIAVLDDVLMSVDAGHRREVSSMLKKNFPNVQFIFTTHDDVWLRHMRSEGLIKDGGSIHFQDWDVNNGPTPNDSGKEIWEKIDKELNTDNIKTAAGSLRDHLEYISADLCHRLGAEVRYRGDGRYDLGSLMPVAIKRYSTLLTKGIEAAKSWDNKELQGNLEKEKKDFSELKSVMSDDWWQINSAIHFNNWANLEKNDFKHTVNDFRELIESLRCKKCNCLFYVLPERGVEESVRCNCGEKFNLKKK
jgi:recombinational DNA repair ATPase RecF